MELYGRIPGSEGSEPDVPADWGETGLEESMWRLGLTGRESYPERPDVVDCVYYMRTGICGFGSRCRYNHPRDRAAAAAAIKLVGGVYPERPGQPACQYYLKSGTCKFGATCKFHHPRNAGGSLSSVPLNYQGYPLRPSEQECSYYLKTGQCKFGATCKFHHPQTSGVSVPTPAPAFYPPVQSLSVPHPEQIAGGSNSYGIARPPLLSSSYVPGAYGPVLLSPGVVPISGWTSYSGPVSPVLSPGAQASTGSVYGVTQLSSSPSAVAGQYQLQSTDVKEVTFPERPGKLECQFYLKTGDCKYGSSCRYHHPPDRAASVTPCILNPQGLPLRPETQACSFYMQNGYCKFGRTCKFDHPTGAPMHVPPSSSISEMPVVPYMVSPLLPSTTSSAPDCFLDYPSGSASTSVGFTFSQTWPVSLFNNVHRPGQGST